MRGNKEVYRTASAMEAGGKRAEWPRYGAAGGLPSGEHKADGTRTLYIMQRIVP
jgi:hypothetical protein